MEQFAQCSSRTEKLYCTVSLEGKQKKLKAEKYL